MSHFLLGIKFFLSSAAALFRNPLIFAWFRKVSLVSLVVAMFVLFVCLALGVWGISNLANHWIADVGAALWIFALLFFSGSLCMILMSIFVSLLGSERQLLRAITGNLALELKKATFVDLRREWMGTLISSGMAILAWPFFLLPFLFPVGLLLLSWAFGRESLFAANRIWHQTGRKTFLDEEKPKMAFCLGLGIGPAVISIVPVVGWAMWPLLLITAIRSLESYDSKMTLPNA